MSALTKLSPLSRFLQILAVLCLGSFLTLSSKEGYMWQVWSSVVVLFHLFFWKSSHSLNHQYEEQESDIWSQFFQDISDEDFQIFLDSSDWREFSFNGTISADREYFVLNFRKDESKWQKLDLAQNLVTRKGELMLFVDVEILREESMQLETVLEQILRETPRTTLAS